jgi:ABC-2 type transport system permease protein
MLNNILPVIRKELRSYFNSPIAYVVTVTFVLFCSIWVFYLQTFFAANTASLRSLFGIVPLAFIIIMPAITMRSWAEEKKLGTMEVLLTRPFRESTRCCKFLAACCCW